MILLTGVTGHVGKRTAALLAGHGHKLRLLARDPAKAPKVADSEVVQADYADPSSLDAAFAGVNVALIVSGSEEPGKRAELHKNAFDAAARAHVGHLVYLSFQGASTRSKFPYSRDHHLSEQYLSACGVPCTVLRDNMYLDMLPEMINAQGIIRGPAKQGAAAFVAREDVAQIAAAVLTKPTEFRGIFDVTGPEAITLSEAARRLSALVGKELRYQDEPHDAALQWRRELGGPAWQADVWVGSYEALAAGELAHTSDIVLRVCHRQPLGIETYFNKFPQALSGLRAKLSNL